MCTRLQAEARAWAVAAGKQVLHPPGRVQLAGLGEGASAQILLHWGVATPIQVRTLSPGPEKETCVRETGSALQSGASSRIRAENAALSGDQLACPPLRQ